MRRSLLEPFLFAHQPADDRPLRHDPAKPATDQAIVRAPKLGKAKGVPADTYHMMCECKCSPRDVSRHWQPSRMQIFRGVNVGVVYVNTTSVFNAREINVRCFTARPTSRAPNTGSDRVRSAATHHATPKPMASNTSTHTARESGTTDYVCQ
jgi:hypothetical protein